MDSFGGFSAAIYKDEALFVTGGLVGKYDKYANHADALTNGV